MAKKFLTSLKLVNLPSDPSVGSEGELYFNSSASVAKIYQAGAWSVLGAGAGGGTTVSTTEPASPEIGDSWYKNDTGEFYVYDGTYWVEVNGTISLTQEEVQDYIAPMFTSASGTNVVAIYDDANNVINLNTSGSLISVDSIVYPDYITFDTTPETSSNATGTIFWDSGDGLPAAVLNSNVTIGLGQEQVALVKNATGSSIAKGKVVYINGAQGQRPTITLSDADAESTSSKTFGVTSETIADGAEGFVTTFGVLRGVNTDGLTEGAALWLSSTAGGYTTTIPAEPAHSVFIGYVVKAHASSGEIFINIQNGYELNELHGVLISGSIQNNELLSYDLSNGLWINKTANEAGIATTEDLSEYLTTSSAAILYQPFSVRLFNLTALEGAPGILRSDGGLGWSLDPTEFLPTFTASSTYLTQVDASDIYLTQLDAENSYLTPASANSLYQPLDGDLTAIAALSGSSGFLKKNIFDDWVIDSNTYLTTYDASTLYQTAGNYATISGVETLSNKTMSAAFVSGDMTFNDIDYEHTISSGSNNFTITGYNNLNLVSANGSIVLQPDEFVKIYDEHVATQEWVQFQDYLTESSASATYSVIGHNHTLDSLSNVVITGTPTDGQAIVWDTSTSKWVNETIASGSSYPDQTGNNGKFLQTNGASVSWQNVDFTGYLTEISASTTYQPIGSYLTSTISDQVNITNSTTSTSTTTGALVVTGGVGIGDHLHVAGDIHVDGDINITGSISGSLTYVNVTDLVVTDPLIYLAEGNPNDSVDVGIFAALNHGSSAYYHTGLIRDASDSGKWKLASNLLDPTSNVIDFTGATFDTLKIGALEVTDASTTRTNLGLTIGTDVQAYNATLAAVAGGTYTGDDSITTLGTITAGTWNGSTIGYAYGGTGLTSLGSAGYVLAVNATVDGLEWVEMTGGGSSFTNSSELAALLSDETGSGSVVFSNSPTLTTPNIGAATGTSLTTTGNVISHVDISTPTFVTNSYTITSTDDGKLLMLDNSTTVGNLLIPTDATFNFPIGTLIKGSCIKRSTWV